MSTGNNVWLFLVHDGKFECHQDASDELARILADRDPDPYQYAIIHGHRLRPKHLFMKLYLERKLFDHVDLLQSLERIFKNEAKPSAPADEEGKS